MLVLGIDPGSYQCGWGVIKKDGNKFTHIDHGVIILSKKDLLHERLGQLFTSTSSIIEKYNPSILAIEKSFFAKNASVAMKLGQVRGVIIVAGALKNILVSEYSPNEIKLALVGFGHASKLQMQKMAKAILGLAELPQTDAADALAVGICHLQQSRLSSKLTTLGKNHDRLSAWKFVSKRPY